MISRRVVFTLAALLTFAAAARAQQTTVSPGASLVTVNAGPGNQTDPHINGTLIAYTSSVTGVTQIRYFDLATRLDSGIPTTGTSYDFLSAVGGALIVFTRIDNGKQAIFAFDTATAGPAYELDPQPGSNRRGPAIGGRTVAWQDLGFTTDEVAVSEIVLYDMDIATTVRLTNDVAYDRNPSVSPDGSVVAWEKCLTSTSPCDIYQAVKGASGWTVTQVTNTDGAESSPDTNGTLVVYGGNRAGNATGADIYWTPVAGGTEQQLSMAGDERNPNVAGNLIVFESRNPTDPTPNWDIYAYDVSTKILYRLTNTPLFDETLNAVSVTGNEAHVAYSVLETDQNVYAQTFTLISAQYDFTGTGGFQSPIANAPAVNVVNAGRVIPIKWQLRDASGAYITDLDVVSGLLVQPVPCGTLATNFDNAVAAETSGSSGLRFDSANNQFVFNWVTSSTMAGSCRAFVLHLNDGSEYPAYFRLK